MSKKATLTDVSSGYSSGATLNDNFESLNTQFENTLSLDGSTPNAMEADLDLNDNDLLNAKDLYADKLYLNNQRVTSLSSTPSWEGAWVTATEYAVDNLVSNSGNTYICIVAHTSGTFSTDLTNNYWELFASKGASGAGTGDMVAANNLSDVDDVADARANLGLGTAATTASTDYATAAQGALADVALPSANKADQTEAETGTDNTKYMTPLRTKQAIDALVPDAADVPQMWAGTVTLAANAPSVATVTFPTPFSSTPVISATPVNSTPIPTADTGPLQVVSPSTTGCQIRYDGNASTRIVHVFAIDAGDHS